MNTFFTTLKIGQRLLIGFGILIILLLGASGLSLWGNNAINQNMDAAIAEYQKMERTYQINTELDAIYLNLGDLTLSPDASRSLALQADIETQRTSYKQHLSELKSLETTGTGKELLTKLEDALVAGRAANDQVISLTMAGNQIAGPEGVHRAKSSREGKNLWSCQRIVSLPTNAH